MSGFLSGGSGVSLGNAGIGDVLSFAANLKLGPWAWGLQRASWNGVPFAVKVSTIRRGRRVAVHEYPYRDDVWVEDLGRGTRVVSLVGFLVGDDVFAQRDSMLAACETEGVGVLVHPSLGRLDAALSEFTAIERADLGRVVELEFSFVQSTPKPTDPTSSLSTTLALIASVVQLGVSTARDYINAVTTAISGINAGLSFASNLFATVKGVLGGGVLLTQSLINDSAVAANVVLGLPGTFGRYAFGTSVTPQPATATVATAIAALTVARTAALAAGAVVNATVDPALLPAAVQALTEAVRAVANDPADQIRILTSLASYAPSGVFRGYAGLSPPSAAPIGSAIVAMQGATAGLVRASALMSIANAVSAYRPASYNDAILMQRTVTGLFDAEILSAADAGYTATYLALRALRSALVLDLQTRAAKLPRLVTVTSAQPTPALALAYSLYADASRCDELVRRANPVAPLFMPLSFPALSS